MFVEVQALRVSVNRRLTEFQSAGIRMRREVQALEEAEAAERAQREAQALAQEVAQQVQELAHQRIASVVSRCLSTVLDGPYEFRIRFEQKRGRTEAALVFCRDDMEVDPMTAAGGGVVDVAAFSLRLSCLLLSRPPLRRLLVLDEPFKFVSEEFRPRIKELLVALAKEMEVQFLMVTHIPELRVGKVIELGGEAE